MPCPLAWIRFHALTSLCVRTNCAHHRYATEARAQAHALAERIVRLIEAAGERGLTQPGSVAERMVLLAQEAQRQLEAIAQTDAPRMREWLITLGEPPTTIDVVGDAVVEMGITSGAWELLSAWRQYFASLREMPLVKLQLRADRSAPFKIDLEECSMITR